MSDQTPTYIVVPATGDIEGQREGDTWEASDGTNKPYQQADMPGFRVIDPGILQAMFGDEG